MDMFSMGWGVNGEAWKWQRRLFTWEEELVRECVGRLTPVVLQVGSADRWIWHLHSSQCYSVSSAYNKLSKMGINQYHNSHNFVWLKVNPLKVSIFAWKLLRNRVPTRNNLFQWRIIACTDQECTAACGMNKDVNHLFVNCNFYGRLWYLISRWLGFSTVYNSRILEHIYQFDSLGGFSHKAQCSLYVIWLSVAWIIWQECNKRIFQRKEENLQAFCERVKLQSYWWFKSKYVLFNFDYQLWRLNPIFCLTTVT